MFGKVWRPSASVCLRYSRARFASSVTRCLRYARSSSSDIVSVIASEGLANAAETHSTHSAQRTGNKLARIANLLVGKQASHGAANQNLDRQFIPHVFVRRLFPCKMRAVTRPHVPDDFHRSLQGAEYIPVSHVQLRTGANFAHVFMKGRLEICLSEVCPWQAEPVESTSELARIADPWSAEKLKRSGRAASLGNVRPFQQTHSGIHRRSIECRHVGRWHDPGQPGLVVPHLALPARHRQEMELAARENVSLKELCKLPDGLAMPHGDRVQADK